MHSYLMTYGTNWQNRISMCVLSLSPNFFLAIFFEILSVFLFLVPLVMINKQNKKKTTKVTKKQI